MIGPRRVLESIVEKLDPRIRSHLPECSGMLLVVVAIILTWVVWEYHRTVAWVNHSFDVQQSILNVSAKAHEAEAAGRGFLITGSDAYLAHFPTLEAKLATAVARLSELTTDNAGQQRAIVSLTEAINVRFVEMSRLIDARRVEGGQPQLLATRMTVGLTAMESVRAIIDQMSAIESNLHRSRVASVQSVIFLGGLASSFGLLIVLASMVAWSWDNRREANALLATIAERQQNESQIRQMQKIEAVGQLTGGLAHDFNNMLAVIISGLALAQKRLAAGDKNVDRFISAAMDGATRAASLTNRLMTFSRQLPLAPQPIDANRLVSGMLELMQRTLGELIQIKTLLRGGLWTTNADEGQLENAILNLAVNARDAMQGGGKLIIETANFQADAAFARQNDIPVGDYVLIAVTDTGSGMTPDVAAKAFDPFYTTKGVGKGTGLGLSQVYGFIKQSGGQIRIYSEPDHGTTVKMYLPRLANASAVTSTSIDRDVIWSNDHAQNARNIVLVVEDDNRVREMSVASLRELGFTVIHANSAKDGLNSLDAHPETTVLFTDIVMPEIDGRQLAGEALRRRPNLKVLYTTGFSGDAIKESERLDPGLHLITKPFTLTQLDAKMHEVLTEKAVA